MTHDVVFLADAIAAMHVARGTRNIERLAAIVALDDGDHLRRELALIHQAAHLQRALQPERNLGHRVGKLFLDQLRLRQRLAELHTIQRVLPRTMHAVFSRSKNAP